MSIRPMLANENAKHSFDELGAFALQFGLWDDSYR